MTKFVIAYSLESHISVQPIDTIGQVTELNGTRIDQYTTYRCVGKLLSIIANCGTVVIDSGSGDVGSGLQVVEVKEQ